MGMIVKGNKLMILTNRETMKHEVNFIIKCNSFLADEKTNKIIKDEISPVLRVIKIALRLKM